MLLVKKPKHYIESYVTYVRPLLEYAVCV